MHVFSLISMPQGSLYFLKWKFNFKVLKQFLHPKILR